MAGEPEGLAFSQIEFRQARGALVELHNAIPVPDLNTPLEEILEFKFRRNDELNRLRLEMDNFFESWLNSLVSEDVV